MDFTTLVRCKLDYNCKGITKLGYEVLLLGGEQEDLKIKTSQKSGAKYFGNYNLQKFISLVDKCDLVITAVTMAMHITIGLNKNNSLQ